MNRFGGYGKGNREDVLSASVRGCFSTPTGSMWTQVGVLSGHVGSPSYHETLHGAHRDCSIATKPACGAHESTFCAKEATFSAHECSFFAHETICVTQEPSRAAHEDTCAADEPACAACECSCAADEPACAACERSCAADEPACAACECSCAAVESTCVAHEGACAGNEAFVVTDAAFGGIGGHPRAKRSRSASRIRAARNVLSMKIRCYAPGAGSHAGSPPPGMRSTVFR